MFNNHISGVVNALLMNLTNAVDVRLNGKIQELKTVGRGYRTFLNSLEVQYCFSMVVLINIHKLELETILIFFSVSLPQMSGSGFSVPV